MIHVLQGPFDQGHILLIGHSDPVPFLVLSAQCCGYTLVHMSDVFSTKLLAKNSSNLDGMSAKSYRSPQFKEDLKTLFLRAGVKVIMFEYSVCKCASVLVCVCVLCVHMYVCSCLHTYMHAHVHARMHALTCTHSAQTYTYYTVSIHSRERRYYWY